MLDKIPPLILFHWSMAFCSYSSAFSVHSEFLKSNFVKWSGNSERSGHFIKRSTFEDRATSQYKSQTQRGGKTPPCWRNLSIRESTIFTGESHFYNCLKQTYSTKKKKKKNVFQESFFNFSKKKILHFTIFYAYFSEYAFMSFLSIIEVHPWIEEGQRTTQNGHNCKHFRKGHKIIDKL